MGRRYRNINRDVVPPSQTPPDGMERHTCHTHGFLADTLPDSSSWCPCGRLGKVTTSNHRSTS